ncbi:uncharacterized protein zgc:153345 isoform X2 [Esox lucius]|uniref:uncharacterized protein zgc:153345 isoform X2 n=1 Tax=Esox lucius TaxID=8010 RepID=UPI00147751CD|nr:uncharacterized protein zgc:153345 isoform X2 [Esox lucius]
MSNPMDDRLRVVAVIHALKASGVRVKNWKNFLNGTYMSNPVRQIMCLDVFQENQSEFAFGRDLTLLPQCEITDMNGTVPKFLVDSCEFLSQHLHTEGLFRKTGSLSRIRALRADLEQAVPVFSLPHSATLQPCDVASLVKQFLRELPSPLIPLDLQVPLCRALGLEEDVGQEQVTEGATLLLTALFPPCHSRALRYFCTFLRQTAQRSKENRMEVGNLALVIAPNLLHCPAGGFRLTAGTERQLDRQAAVIKTLITHADCIGVVPPSVMELATVAESGELSVPPGEGGRFQERAAFGVYRSLRRQRRRSVGEIFVDALSKFKTGRACNGSSFPSDSQQNIKTSRHSTLQSPVTFKRKSIEDPVPDVEGSAKKRRSIHDLREENQSTSTHSNDSESLVGQSPTSVLSGEEGSRVNELSVTLSALENKRNLNKDRKTSNKQPVQEDKAQRRRSLRFFNMTSWNIPNPSPVSIGDRRWITGSRLMTNGLMETSCSEVGQSRISVIMADGPERVLVGKEVEDDPDLLNYSFTELPDDFLDVTIFDSSTKTHSGESCEHSPVKLEYKTTEEPRRQCETIGVLRSPEQVGIKDDPEEASLSKKPSNGDPSGCVGQKPRHPRRSISMPEVTLDQLNVHDQIYKREKKNGLLERDCEVSEEPWFPGVMTLVDKGLSKGMDEAEELEEKPLVKKEKPADSGLAFKKAHQRLSVADHLRRFNALAMLLRTPRVPPQAPEPQLNHVLHESQREGGLRSIVRLRRQGARRFGRSISHDGVPSHVTERACCQQEEPVVVQSPGVLDRCLPPEPNVFIKSVHQPALEGQIPIQHAPGLQIEQDNLSETLQVLCFSPLPGPKENLESCHRQFNNSQLHFKEGELQPLQGQSTVSDLHDLLKTHLNLCDPKDELENDLTNPVKLDGTFQTDTVSDDFTQTMTLQQEPRTTELPLPPTPPLSQTETCSSSPSIPSPTSIDRTTSSTDLYTAHLVANYSPTNATAFDFTGMDMEVSKGDVGFLPVERSSPPALQIRLQGTRRRYRDSPRWPINAISVATGDPLQM